MEASQQQILATKKRVIRKVGHVEPVVVKPVILLDPHECLKCNKVGDWTEVYYDEFLCGVCIHGKCLYCQRGIYGKHYGEELCEPCFDKYKAWNIEQNKRWNMEQTEIK
jgi:hypothetical protein